jgi:CDGSH-type Zn-finger protein
VIEGPGMLLRDKQELCAGLRFCHNQKGNVWDLATGSGDLESKEEVMRQVCNCASGRLTAIDKKDGKKVEPELLVSIGLAEDPAKKVSGPILVKGGIEIESAEGIVYEKRNRCALCRCGKSVNKPFCDASHIAANFNDGSKELEN